MDFTKLYLEQLNINKSSRLDFLKEQFSNIEITQNHIIELLQISLIDQWLAEFNYFRSYHLSQTSGKSDFDPQFKQHEEDEYQHRHQIADRIRQLNARISVLPIIQLLNQNSDGENWKEESSSNSFKILKNRLEEQKKAVQFYSFVLSVINRMKDKDTTTYALIRNIKADEEQHVKDLNDLAIQNGIQPNVGLIAQQYDEGQNNQYEYILTIDAGNGYKNTFNISNENDYAKILDWLVDTFDEDAQINETIPPVLPCAQSQSYPYEQRLQRLTDFIIKNKETNKSFNIIKNNQPRVVYGTISFNER